MASKKQEGLADIVTEKLARANEIESAAGRDANQFQRELIADLRAEADRIEAAWNRETSKNASKNGAVFGQLGDVAAMRKALVQIRDMIMGDSFDGRSPAYIVNICEAALGKPPRNCDVGTAEEQYSRMLRECHEWMCRDCKPSDKDFRKCAISWAQMPYEEGGAK